LNINLEIVCGAGTRIVFGVVCAKIIIIQGHFQDEISEAGMLRDQMQSQVKSLAVVPGLTRITWLLALIVMWSCTCASSSLAGNSYRHPRGYFTVPVPDSWQAKSDGPSTSLSRGNFFVTILVFENNTDSSAVSRQLEGQYAQQWRNFSSGPGGKFPLGNLEEGSYKLYRGINPSGVHAKLEIVAAADASRTYAMLLSGPEQAWADYDKEWHDILYGFDICGAPGSKCRTPNPTPSSPSSGSLNSPAAPTFANRAVLGLQSRDINPMDLGTNGLTVMQGVLVTQLLPGSPAAQAGIQIGDVIGAIDDNPIRSSSELVQIMGKFSPGDTIAITVIKSGRPKTLEVRLAGASGPMPIQNRPAAGPTPQPARKSLILPSWSMLQFRGNGFAVSIPSNWTSTLSPGRRVTYLSAPDGRQKQTGEITTILLGMIVGYEEKSINDLKRNADKQVQNLTELNPGLRILEHRSAMLGGQPAEFISMEGESPLPGEKEIDWMYITFVKNQVCYLTLTCPASQFSNLKSVFEEIVTSFRLQ
jgi:membrane-associated protease RseP (regulator of RpoE activity)